MTEKEDLIKVIRASLIGTIILPIALCALGAEAQDYSCTNCFIDLAAGEDHACGVREDGSIACWGRDHFGKSSPPELDADFYDFLLVTVGNYHACAIVDCDAPPGESCLIDNTVCWGDNSSGQSSVGFHDHYDLVTAGEVHSCGLNGETISCWGSDDDGQATVPSPPSGRHFTNVEAGGYHTCALTACDDFCVLQINVMCWGRDDDGQATVPPGSPQFKQISAGKHHTCGVKTDGSVVCWGRNTFGQATPPPDVFEKVSVGESHTCGLQTDGFIRCWGYNLGGETNPPPSGFEDVSAGSYFTCGVRTNGSLACWGLETNNRTYPPAGLCGVFSSDFENGGDCRWSNSETPCWTADCDGEGAVSDKSTGYCQPDMPVGLPPECPTGTWIDRVARGAAYDCSDNNPNVYSGQMDWFSSGYNPGGGTYNRYDYNCDGVEERRYTDLSTSLCCADVGGCVGLVGPPGCDPYGWDTASVTEVPECGETADYLVCGPGGSFSCVQLVESRTQSCR